MSNKKNKTKKMSLRQRLRQRAEGRLDALQGLVNAAMIRVGEEADTDINLYDVLRMMVGTQTKTIREKLITELANEEERRLEALYNSQQALDLEVNNDD